MIQFREHHGIENDVTGLRCWYADHDHVEYAIWEIPRTLHPVTLQRLVPGNFYRLNWRQKAEEPNFVIWSFVNDEPDFDAAVARANLDFVERSK